MANSTELPGHDNVHTMLSKVKHQVSDILPNQMKMRRSQEDDTMNLRLLTVRISQ